VTVIVAARTLDRGVVVAADSEISDDWTKQRAATPKIWTSSGALFGFCGDLRPAQVVKHFAEWPDLWPGDDEPLLDVEKFLLKEIWGAIQWASESHHTVKTILETNLQSVDADFIVAWGDNLAAVYGNGEVLIPFKGSVAIGSGFVHAQGHLADEGPYEYEDVLAAVRKAKNGAVGVGGPIYVANTIDLEIEEVS
jgi:ATP-dependent protease HslVU (ClpYQ) peptidase subunit